MKAIKIKYLLIIYTAFFALIFLSCNSSSKNENIDNNKLEQNNDTIQQTINLTDTINQKDTIVTNLKLFKTFKELTNSDAFKTATLTAYDFSTIDLGVTEGTGCKIVKQEENNFIVMAVWTLTVGSDTIIFQKLKEKADYSIYAYNENGSTESPFMEHSGFFVFKRYKNGNWETLNLKEINSSIVEKTSGRVLGIYSYDPHNKTFYFHKTESYIDAGETKHFVGKIEVKFKWLDTQEDFIFSHASDLPNPILIQGGHFSESSDCATNYTAKIDTKYFRDTELKNEKEITFTYDYTRANDKKVIYIDEKTKKDIINNKDKNIKIWVKYKPEIILECNPMCGPNYEETEVNVIEDYETIGQSPVIATFTGFEMQDFVWYEFTSRLGYKYYFNEIKNNKNKYSLENDHGDGPNPKYDGKKFKLDFHSELIDNEFGTGKFNYMIIDSIELINNR